MVATGVELMIKVEEQLVVADMSVGMIDEESVQEVEELKVEAGATLETGEEVLQLVLEEELDEEEEA